MNVNQMSGYQGLRVDAQVLIEDEQTPFLSMHFDKTSERVFILADSESVQKLRAVEALIEIEDILKRTFKESKKLTMVDQKAEVGNSACLQGAGVSAQHTCHAIKPQYQLSWEKSLQGCFHDRAHADVDYVNLPKEILRSIFEYLEPSDLQSVILVSRYWKSVADEPTLWKEFRLPSKCKKSQTKFFEFFQKSISSKLQDLDLSDFSFQLNDNHFEKLLRLDLTRITIGDSFLFNISDEYLAQVVNNSNECRIREYDAELKTTNGTNLNVLGLNKMKAIFRQMESGTKLKSLELTGYADPANTLDLSFIPSSTLANAFNRLESLALYQVKLRQKQLKTMFDNMRVKTKLKNIKLDSMKLDSVDIKIFDFAFSNLAHLHLGAVELDNAQLKHVVENLDKNCKLKFLRLSEMNVKEVSPGLLARVVSKINSVHLASVEVTVEQLDKIFNSMSTGSSAIKKLVLSDIADVNQINPEALAKGINKLMFFDFAVCRNAFTEDQTKSMFKVMSQGTNLKILGTSTWPWDVIKLENMANIKKVDPEILAEAIHNLEEVKLGFEDSSLTLAQYIAIFKKFGEKSKIKKVYSQKEEIYMYN